MRPRPRRNGKSATSRPRAADPAGNQRLTAMTGAVLLALVIAECLTLLQPGPSAHAASFLGMLLIGPVCLEARLDAVAFHQVLHGRGGLRAERVRRLRCSG